MDTIGTYRLFGDLYLDDPSANLFLSHRLKQIQPYLAVLEARNAEYEVWDCKKAFSKACHEEVTCWEKHGVTRDIRFLIPPDGPLDAPLSCHLHNPNFNVFNPYSSYGADDSNLSMRQIMSAGFTPDKVLIYDHTFRRDPMDGLEAYPPDVLEIHEGFTSELRNHMAAVVDIVWGAKVRDRMRKTHRLEELRLWGRYKGVSIFLEWELDGHILRRFVIFVCHPEAMIYGEPATLGKKQDLHLEVAAKLARIRISENFYERLFRPKDYKHLAKAELARRNDLNEQAKEQVELVAYRFRHPTNIDRQKRNRTPPSQRTKLRQYPGLHRYFDKKEEEELVKLDAEINIVEHDCQNEEDNRTPVLYMNPQIEKNFAAPNWLKLLASSLLGENERELEGDTVTTDSMQICQALVGGEFDLSEFARWEDLPRELRIWIQNQDGLKVDGRPVVSLSGLLEVHGLILKKPMIAEADLNVHVTKIFVEIVARYYHLATYAARESSVENLIERGKQSIPLKCSCCGARLLDDAYPRFKKLDAQRYVVRNLKRGCGSQHCQIQQKPGFAIPQDGSIPWTPAKVDALERHPMKADWTDVLLLKDPITEGLPKVVQIMCRACKDQSSIEQDDSPRWTIETPPRYVIRKPRCKACCRNDVTWSTVDAEIPWLDQASISKMWGKKKKENWDVDDMVRNPSAYFPKKQEERRAMRDKRAKFRIRYQL